MANTFTNASVAVSSTSTRLYQCSTSGTVGSVIHAVYISNTGTTGTSVNVDVTVTGANAPTGGSAADPVYIANDVEVPYKGTLILDKPINLAASDELKIKASTNNSVEAFASILEIT